MSLVSRYLDPPLLERLQSLTLTARRVVEGATTGPHRSPMRGASVEFRQHRAYVAGDEPRRLDWRVLARTDRPYVREYDEETNLRCTILLDRSGSMAYRGAKRTRKFDYAARIAASLSYLMLGQTESVGLATFDTKMEAWVPPHSSSGQLARIIDVLERTSPAGQSNPPAAMIEAAGRIGRRSLVVTLSDLFTDAAELRRALACLRHGHHEVISLRVLDDDEMKFPFEHWLRIRGLEGEASRLCEPAILRKRYVAAFDEHSAALDEAHRAVGVELYTFQTGRDLGDSLIGFLRRRHG
jgi:uncharacterized protein (DUF58 family)